MKKFGWLLGAVVLILLYAVFLIIGKYYPAAMLYLVIITYSYYLVDRIMHLFEAKKPRSFHVDFVILFLGITISALIADAVVARMPEALKAYDPLWQDFITSSITLAAAYAIVRQNRRNLQTYSD